MTTQYDDYNPLIEVETADDDFRGKLHDWLASNLIEPEGVAHIVETLKRGEDYADEDETHGCYLRIHVVDLSVFA